MDGGAGRNHRNHRFLGSVVRGSRAFRWAPEHRTGNPGVGGGGPGAQRACAWRREPGAMAYRGQGLPCGESGGHVMEGGPRSVLGDAVPRDSMRMEVRTRPGAGTTHEAGPAPEPTVPGPPAQSANAPTHPLAPRLPLQARRTLVPVHQICRVCKQPV